MRRILAALTVSALLASPAFADKPGHAGRGKEKGKGSDVVVFHDDDRDSVRSYWVETYGRGNCPPGLAKKDNGCLPPGQAKKRYVVGQRLPRTVLVQPVPRTVITRLRPAPAGYEYVMVDGDILKLAVGTRLVVDAIDAFVR
jgi:uncharacterized protein DUF1236